MRSQTNSYSITRYSQMMTKSTTITIENNALETKRSLLSRDFRLLGAGAVLRLLAVLDALSSLIILVSQWILLTEPARQYLCSFV